MFFFLLFLLGLVIGSFLNVLIDRLPNEESITGRSHCDHCKTNLTWKDLFPVFSFITLGGKCRYCKKKLSLFYPLVEILTGVLFVLVGLSAARTSALWVDNGVLVNNKAALDQALLSIHFNTLMLIALLGIVSSVIVIFFSDLKYQIIPDSVEVLLFAFVFLLLFAKGVTPRIFLDQILSAFAVMIPILLVFLMTKGNGMGFGDVKLAFNIGFLLGIVAGMTALYIGFIAGAIVGVILIVMKRKKMKSTIAFGPFLVIGLLTMLFFQNEILTSMRGFFKL